MLRRLGRNCPCSSLAASRPVPAQYGNDGPNQIAVYKTRKMRYILHTSGPDFPTRYLEQPGLDTHRAAISDRISAHAPQRNTYAKDPRIRVLHQLSWVKQLDLTKAQVPELPGQGPAPSRKLNAKGGADLAEEIRESRVVDQLVGQARADHERLSSDSASQSDLGSVVSIPGPAADADCPHPKRTAHGDAEAVPPRRVERLQSGRHLREGAPTGVVKFFDRGVAGHEAQDLPRIPVEAARPVARTQKNKPVRDDSV